MSLDLDRVPQRVQGVRERMLEDELLLYFQRQEAGCTLSPTAQSIWELCDGARSLRDISGELERRHDLPAGLLSEDVGATVRKLAELQVLVLRSGESSAPEPADIDWSRVAEPQDDQSDTDAALRVLAARDPEGRLPENLRPDRPRIEGAPSLFDGRVRLAPIYDDTPPKLVNAPPDHPNIARAAELLTRYWPAAAEQFPRLVHTVHPLIWPEIPEDETAYFRGAHSHGCETRLGTLWSSVNCPYMLAECLVHEMGHIKLFALGVYKELAVALVENAPTEMFKSPVITTMPRPMTAVLHGVYAFAFVTELDLRFLEQGLDEEMGSDPPRRLAEILQSRIGKNLARLDAGMEEIRPNIRLDAHGKTFLAGFEDWMSRLHARAAKQGAGEQGVSGAAA